MSPRTTIPKTAKESLVKNTPPIFQTLPDYMQGNKPNEKCYERLVTKFEERYARKTNFVTHAPGRVDIIKEHS